ncbi:MAG: hypothetical protein IPK85_02370 [Gemmatimonadetes bacterium]|nr:hypothetical protein [Gemmatimonadota bacterium]
MIVEPMTPDLAVATLRGWADHMRAENAILQTRSGFIISADVLDVVLSTISTLTAERDQHATAYIELHGQHVAKMIELADARSALKRAEAERDAAVARAMPEPRLMRTVEEVEALPEGSYLIRLPSSIRAMLWVKLSPRIFGQGAWMAHSRALCGNAALVEAVVAGPLPDLPTPTAAQEAANG